MTTSIDKAKKEFREKYASSTADELWLKEVDMFLMRFASNLRSDLLAQIERELGKLPVIYLGSHPVFKKQGVESGYYIEKDDVLQALKHLKEKV